MKPNDLVERLATVESRIVAACTRAGRKRDDVQLVAVTKTIAAEIAQYLPVLGYREFGENRPQELWHKAALIPAARWHLIGHLQRNKIDKTIPLTTLVHSVDSVRLLEALHDFGQKRGMSIPMLLEVNCSREVNKGGFAPEELPALAERLPALGGVSVQGLMTMAAYSENPEACRPTFAELRQLRDQLRTQTGLTLPNLSMGMSGDFEVAIEEGATHIRLGSVLFEGLK